MVMDDSTLKISGAGADRSVDLGGSIVFEDAKQPDYIAVRYRVHCGRKTLEGFDFTNHWRDKPASLIGSGQLPEHPPGDASEEQVLAFACADRAQWRDPRMNFLALGPQASASDYIWQAIWSDGERPGKPATATPEQREKFIAEMEQQQARTNATVARGLATADRALRQTAAQNAGGGYAAEAQVWVGRPERDLAAAWGAPRTFRDDGQGNRTLNYEFGYSEQMVRVATGEAVGDRGYQLCYVTIHVLDGIVESYEVSQDHPWLCRQYIPH